MIVIDQLVAPSVPDWDVIKRFLISWYVEYIVEGDPCSNFRFCFFLGQIFRRYDDAAYLSLKSLVGAIIGASYAILALHVFALLDETFPIFALNRFKEFWQVFNLIFRNFFDIFLVVVPLYPFFAGCVEQDDDKRRDED